MNKKQLIKIIAIPVLIGLVAGISYNLLSKQINQSGGLLGATVLFPYQGGTGVGSTGAGNVNKCLSVSSVSPLTYTFSACSAGVGGSGITAFGIRSGYSGLFNRAVSSSFEANNFNVNFNSTTQVASISLDWTNGPASRSATQNITGLWTFANTGSMTDAGSFDVTKSITTSKTLTAAGISNTVNYLGGGTGSSSFAGSLLISKGLTANSYQSGGLTACIATGKVLRYTSGQFSCGTLTTSDIDYSAVFQPLDATLTSLAAYNTNGLLTQTAADTFTGRTIQGTTNQITVTNGDGVSGNPVLSIPVPFIIPGRASVSSNFEVLGFASVSGNFTGNGTGSNSFAGSLDITKSVTVQKSIHGVAAIIGDVLRAITSFFFPTYTGTSLSNTNEAKIQTASHSFDYNDNSNTYVEDTRKCFTYVVDSPTASNPGFVGPKMFDNPFTIDKVVMAASGSNAAGWNLQYGSPNTYSTAVFSTNRSASTSLNPTTYSSFTNSAISDGQGLEVKITSRSAVLQSFSVSVCGRYTH